MDNATRTLIIIVIAGVIIAGFFLVKLYISSLKNFVQENSKAISALNALNHSTAFYENLTLNLSHTYDNEKFYDNISCEDFFIYYLKSKRYEVEDTIHKVDYNNERFPEYYQRERECQALLGQFTAPKKWYMVPSLLESYERKSYQELLKKPVTTFEFTVVLHCSKINGVVYADKKDSFDRLAVRAYEQRLSNKSGSFYRDRGIWDALCRVERGKVTNRIRFAVYARDNYRCRYCGRNQYQVPLEVDHIKPIAKGGLSTMDNLQTLCRDCNKAKGNKY